jgi:uncharacterized membrane protein YdbT with pleckstrin-like domain
MEVIWKEKPFITEDPTILLLALTTAILALTTRNPIITTTTTTLTTLIILYTILTAQTTTYYITKTKVIKEQTIPKTTQEIPKNKITEIRIRQNIIQKILKTATITIKTSESTLQLKNIKNPTNIQKLLLES